MLWRCMGLLLVCLLAPYSTADAQTWTKRSYPNEGFEIEFSGIVKVTPAVIPEESKDRVVFRTSYLQDGGKYAYSVTVQLQNVNVNFYPAVNAAYAKTECKVLVVDTALDFQGGQAHEFRGKDCRSGFRIDMRFYTVGKWFYTVQAVYKDEVAAEAAGRRFVESFNHTSWNKP